MLNARDCNHVIYSCTLELSPHDALLPLLIQIISNTAMSFC